MRYTTIWRNKFLTLDASSIEEMADILESASKELREMKEAGIILDPEGGTCDDYALLVTENKEVAEKFHLEEEECFDEDDDEFFEDDDDEELETV